MAFDCLRCTSITYALSIFLDLWPVIETECATLGEMPHTVHEK
jgi:hypothetical protein